MLHWYAVHTKARMELWARSNLWEQELEVYLPQYRKTRSHARRIDQVTVPLFPRYLFVRADLEVSGMRTINGTRGVDYLVSLGNRPAIVGDEIIAEIRARENEDGLIEMDGLDERFVPGDAVRIRTGALNGQVGLFASQDEKQRVEVLLMLLGREVRVKVPRQHIDRED
jgi:transcriptional antiterminator RfaH